VKLVVCNTKQKAQKLSDDYDVYRQLPWSGIEHDTGRIVPNQTLRMAEVLEHPTDKAKFGYPDCADFHADEQGHPAKVNLPNDATVEDKTDEWKEVKPPKAGQSSANEKELKR
jgi:hypothetical protein